MTAVIDELVTNKTQIIGVTRGRIELNYYYIRALPEYGLTKDIYYNGLAILYPGTKVSFQICKAIDGKLFAYNVQMVVN